MSLSNPSDYNSPYELEPQVATFAFTIAVFPNKLVHNVRFRDLTIEDQEFTISEVIQKGLSIIGDPVSQYEFELTKAGLTHCHGMFSSTFNQSIEFQDYVHYKLGLPKVSKDRVCKIVKTIFDSSAWIRYMRKSLDEQDDKSYIPDYNMIALANEH